MYLKIYFKEKPLFITDTISEDLKEIYERPDAFFTEDLSKKSIQNLIKKIEQPEINYCVVLTKDVEVALEAMRRQLLFLQAAGGLVVFDQSILMIFRRGKWDLPKGKLDKGESVEGCAIREVEEETGLTEIIIKEPLMITYHTYYQRNDLILKESHWFLMQCTEKQELIPQTDEDIEKCEWVRIENMVPYLNNTHASLIDVIQAGIKKIKENQVS
ncbi:MAG: NUDIX domain-containing protein [Bacteroidota bacterium]|nr:NUDIX domain-containing protein [Bacteroidota bacterium]